MQGKMGSLFRTVGLSTPDITDALANQDSVPLTTLSGQLYDLGFLLSRKPKVNPNLTVQGKHSDVRLGYTLIGQRQCAGNQCSTYQHTARGAVLSDPHSQNKF